MTKGLDSLKNAIKWYEDRFCVSFTPAEIYALYPKEGEHGWPQPWPIQFCEEFMLSWIQIKPLCILEKQVKWGQDLIIILDMGKVVNVS